ncbi:MAG: hypothetical protein WBG76_12730, partial [Ornithinimicrobium sp.]
SDFELIGTMWAEFALRYRADSSGPKLDSGGGCWINRKPRGIPFGRGTVSTDRWFLRRLGDP